MVFIYKLTKLIFIILLASHIASKIIHSYLFPDHLRTYFLHIHPSADKIFRIYGLHPNRAHCCLAYRWLSVGALIERECTITFFNWHHFADKTINFESVAINLNVIALNRSKLPPPPITCMHCEARSCTSGVQHSACPSNSEYP